MFEVAARMGKQSIMRWLSNRFQIPEEASERFKLLFQSTSRRHQDMTKWRWVHAGVCEWNKAVLELEMSLAPTNMAVWMEIKSLVTLQVSVDDAASRGDLGYQRWAWEENL